jgi:hypothetical protein
MVPRGSSLACSWLLAASGCNALWGIDELGFAGATSPTAGAGAQAGSGGAGTAAGGGGAAGGTPTPGWSRRFGDPSGAFGTDDQQAFGVAVDPAGRVLVTGSVDGVVDFDGDTLVTAGDDAFVASLELEGGAVQWARAFGDNEHQSGVAVAVKDVRAFVAGNFWGQIDLGCGAHKSATIGAHDVFFGLLDLTSGDCAFSKAVTGNGTQTVHDAGAGPTAMLMVGEFFDKVNFGCGDKTANGVDAFVVALGGSGNCLLSAPYTSAALERATAVSVVPGWFVVGGDFHGEINFPSQTVAKLTGGTDQDGWVVSSDGRGALLWAARLGGAGTETVNAVVTTGDGGAIVLLTFDGEVAADVLRVSRGGSDALVVRLSAAGKPVWSVPLGGAGDQYGRAAGLAPDGTVLVAGFFDGALDWNATKSVGAEDIFVAALSEQGQPLWLRTFGDAASQRASDLAIVPGGDFYVLAGAFEGTLDLGHGPLVSAGGVDAFVAKLPIAGP